MTVVLQLNNYQNFENTPHILRSSKWTGIWITWAGGFISFGTIDSMRPIITEEYKIKNSISRLYSDSFLYYGLMGTGVLWSTQFCQQTCEVHTTFGMEFMKVWPFHRNNGINDVQFYVRAGHNIAIRLYTNPGTLFPCFTIIMGDADTLSLVYQASKISTKQYLKTVSVKSLLNFWIWQEFTISIFGSYLRIYSKRAYGNEEMMYVHDDKFTTLRWFSIGSEKGVGMWAIFCSFDELEVVEDPRPPNCINDLSDYGYAGSQWTSLANIPCIPWIADQVPNNEQVDRNFVEGSAIKALNKCRNPLKDSAGPYCYAISSNDNYPSTVKKYHCPVRICQSSECRMAGTANDYIGTLSVTRSGQTCAPWSTTHVTGNKIIKKENVVKNNKTTFHDTKPNNSIKFVKSIHVVNPIYLNDSLYPDNSIQNASNYCRNPSRNIAGTWCYTTDPLVPQDLCNIRDCEKPEECTFYIRGKDEGRRLYVLPEYRFEGLSFSLKAWEPDNPDSITFVFSADDNLKSKFVLKIGDSDNEKVTLYYQSENEELKLVKRKTLPHLLYLGKWSSFIIRIPRGLLQLYYEGAPNPLFEWEHPEPAEAFLPIYYSYNSDKGHTIGVTFDCVSRCHIENTSSNHFTRILPISIWNKQEIIRPNRLQIILRAKGVILIPLFLFPATTTYYGLTIGEINEWIYFLLNTESNVHIYHKQKAPRPLFTTNTWTNITIKWIDDTITVWCNETVVFNYEHALPLLFYYFSLSVDVGGWAAWAANCIPADIDGDPVDGGWSEWGPWACSASCNGGIGTRKRLCNSPEPNIRGEPCLGPSIMTGRCNTIICGDITEDTENLIRRRIKTNYTSLIVNEDYAMTIFPDFEIIAAITMESSKSKLVWIHNGVYVKKSQRITVDNNQIHIQNAAINDSGVYTLSMQRVDMSHAIVKVVSLTVVSKTENVVIRETLSMSVTCNCVDLGYVYSDLTISWMINDKVWKDYGITLPTVVNVDFVPNINASHNGLWKCIVKQNDLNFKWITNMIFVKVIGPPNWRTYLMEDKLTKPIFGWMPSETFVAVSTVVLFFLFTCCIISGAILYFRFRHEKDKEKQNKNYKKEIQLVDNNNKRTVNIKSNYKNVQNLITNEEKHNLSMHVSKNHNNNTSSRRITFDKVQQVDYSLLRNLNKETRSKKKNWKNIMKTKLRKKTSVKDEDEKRKLMSDMDIEE